MSILELQVNVVKTFFFKQKFKKQSKTSGFR